MHLGLVILMTLACSLTFADNIFVGQAYVTDVEGVEPQTVRELFYDAVAELGHQVERESGKADYMLHPKVMKLREAYIVSVRKEKEGTAGASQKLKVREIEYLDKSVLRVVRAVLKKRNVAADAKLGEITYEEANEKFYRRKSRASFIFTFGPAFLGNIGSTGPAYSFGFRKGWALGNYAQLALGLNIAMDDDRYEKSFFFFNPGAVFIDVPISFTYSFTETNFSPFVGVDFGLGIAVDGRDKETTGGFTSGVTGGIKLFRTYDVTVELASRFAILLRPTENEDAMPLLIGFHIGAGF